MHRLVSLTMISVLAAVAPCPAQTQGDRVSVSTEYMGGGIGLMRESAPGVFDIWPYTKEECPSTLKLRSAKRGAGKLDSANFAFSLRLDNCKGKKVELRFHITENTDKVPTSLVYANPDFPVFSYDWASWSRMPDKTLSDDPENPGWKTVTVRHEFTAEPAYIAYQYPYSSERLARFIEGIRESPFCKPESAGKSTDGRDIPQICITDPSVVSGKKTVWIIGLQHSAEIGAGWGIEGIAEFLLSSDPTAAEARRRFVWKLTPMVNVDMVNEGRGRLHWTDENPNREWEKEDPTPEVASVRKTMDEWVAAGNSIEIFLDLHGFSAINDENWTMLALPKSYYDEARDAQYLALISSLKKYIPFNVGRNDGGQSGLARQAGARRFGALSICVDGYVYKWHKHNVIPNLASFYEHGSQVWPLEDIKAAGAAYVRGLVDFSEAAR